MKQFTITTLLFLSLSLCTYAQKDIDTVKGNFDNTTDWYKERQKWNNKMGLDNLLTTKDSLRVRLRDGMNIIDIILKKDEQIEANIYSYVFKLDKKNKAEDIIYKKLPIDDKIALKFLDTLYKLAIPDFYDGYKIPDYPVSVDGILYEFEFSTVKSYKNISFVNPSEALNLKEGKIVSGFVNYIDTLLGLEKNFSDLEQTLTKGKYRIGGMLIYTIH